MARNFCENLSLTLFILGIIYVCDINWNDMWLILFSDRNYVPSIMYGSVMALLKFLKLDLAKKGLPHPSGSLSTIIPTSSIAAANEKVKTFVTTGENKKMKGSYVKFFNEAKLTIARYAAENGIVASLHHFTCCFPNLKESSIRMWRNSYQTELS